MSVAIANEIRLNEFEFLNYSFENNDVTNINGIIIRNNKSKENVKCIAQMVGNNISEDPTTITISDVAKTDLCTVLATSATWFIETLESGASTYSVEIKGTVTVIPPVVEPPVEPIP